MLIFKLQKLVYIIVENTLILADYKFNKILLNF
jgi:uncharacterized protein YwgA